MFIVFFIKLHTHTFWTPCISVKVEVTTHTFLPSILKHFSEPAIIAFCILFPSLSGRTDCEGYSTIGKGTWKQ